MKKKTLKKNPSNRKPISYTYRHTDLQTYRQTYRPSDEAGPRVAFAPKNPPI